MTEGATLGDAIITIADRLQMPVAYVYEVIVKAQPLIALLDFAVVAVTIAAYVISVYMIYRYVKKEFDDKERTSSYYSSDNHLFRLFLICVVAMFPACCTFFFMNFLTEAILACMMPEYMAITKIVHMMGMSL